MGDRAKERAELIKATSGVSCGCGNVADDIDRAEKILKDILDTGVCAATLISVAESLSALAFVTAANSVAQQLVDESGDNGFLNNISSYAKAAAAANGNADTIRDIIKGPASGYVVAVVQDVIASRNTR